MMKFRFEKGKDGKPVYFLEDITPSEMGTIHFALNFFSSHCQDYCSGNCESSCIKQDIKSLLNVLRLK